MNDFNAVPLNGGRFISRGKGRHEVRTIESSELIFCIKGSLTMFEEEKLFELHPGDYLLLRKGRKHGGVRDYPPGLTFYWLHFITEEELPENLPSSGHTANPEQLAIYFQSFLAEQDAVEVDKKILSLLLELIFRELAKTTQPLSPEKRCPQLVRQAEELIKLHFPEELSLAAAAGKLHCNPEYLGRIFQHHTGETFTAKVNRTRVEHAAKLLQNTNSSIKEILNECGFNDPAYFRRIFFRRYGSTPTAFRKFHRTGHKNTV
ncbi:MAG: AraC family transcriptional regulator [Lentisphaerae bacterium]|nr:AraC family transcriptional regulator [Lentisphaerota bacterium]MBQ4330025.1 helix-turn-helix domain-containing protein [Lentisphaeria bacterium]